MQQELSEGTKAQLRLKEINRGRHRKVTQERLAEKLRVSQSLISQALNDQHPETLKRLVHYLGRIERQRARLQAQEEELP